MIINTIRFFYILLCYSVFIFHHACIINIDSSTVWLPAHLSDFGLGDKKSHFWQNAPVTDWSKEQVSIDY
jgi:hypothetical protein